MLFSSRGTGISFFVLVVLAAFIVLMIILLHRRSAASARSKRPDRPGTERVNKPCPLCGTLLNSREKVKSVVYPGEPDKLMHIFGCPRCHPSGEKRRCPACKRELKGDDYVIARVFEKPGRTHVHVLGCTQCRMG